jgi:hypothetical protein
MQFDLMTISSNVQHAIQSSKMYVIRCKLTSPKYNDKNFGGPEVWTAGK